MGKVAAVYFKAGDTVKKDAIIAELDKADLDNSIRQAEIALENARLSLTETQKGNTDAQILKGRNFFARNANRNRGKKPRNRKVRTG